MELAGHETLYACSMKELLQVFSEQASIKRAFFHVACLPSYLVPVCSFLSFYLVCLRRPPVLQMTAFVSNCTSSLQNDTSKIN